MRTLWLVALLLFSSLRVPGQDETVTLDDLMESADPWAKENLDDNAPRVLGDVDQEKVKQFFNDIQKQFHSQYVLDLAMLKDTAKRYGLRTWPLDHRLRPEESARAASSYLADPHGQFKDWRLALAAYNAGEGTVQRLLTQRKARTFDAIAPRLPAETQMYVPRVEATLARREGLKPSQLRVPSG